MIAKAIVPVSSLLLFTSCDPYHNLMVENRSAEEKHLEVVLPNKNYFSPPDSLRLFKTMPQSKYGKILLGSIAIQDKDTSMNHYTFLLPSSHQVLLESGFGIRPYTELMIINHVDTVKVNEKRSRVHQEKPKALIGGYYKLVIDK